jgi:hypothetical protein
MKLIRAFFALFCLVWLTGATWLPLFQQASGGGGASIAPLLSTTGAGGPSPFTIVSGQTFTAGVVAIGVVTDFSSTLTAVSINGVSATQIGLTVTDSSNTSVQMWSAVVPAGSSPGTITLSDAGSVGTVGISAWTITGFTSSTPTANNSFNGLSSTQADPQGPMSSITIASGGVGAFFIGGTFHSATANPTSWTPSPTIIRDASLEAGTSLGNTLAVAGAHTVTAGTITGACAGGSGGVCATGSVSWLFSAMIGATWH